MKHRDLHRQTLILQVSLDAFFGLNWMIHVGSTPDFITITSQKSMISPIRTTRVVGILPSVA
jgi:hypothetical protein